MIKIKEILYEKYITKKLTDGQLKEALKIVEENSDKNLILKSYKKLYLYVGISFVLSSILYFIAFNWSILSNYQKFTVVIIPMIMALLFYLIIKNKLYQKLSLFSICFLVGVLFALFGQIYQTGADPYNLFMNWAIMIIPMVIISKFGANYILLMIITYLALILKIRLYDNAIYMVLVVYGYLSLVYTIMYNWRKNLNIGAWILPIIYSLSMFLQSVFTPFLYFEKDKSFNLAILFYLGFLIFAYMKKDLYFRRFLNVMSLIPLFSLIPTIGYNNVESVGRFFLVGLVNVALYILIIVILIKIGRKKSNG